MRLNNLIGALSALALLAGCAAATSESEVEKLNNTAAIGSEFNRALASEYRELANYEQFQMFDYRDAERHAMKGLMAAADKETTPATFDDYMIDAAHTGELQAARGRLLAVFTRDSRNLLPHESAVAQSRFDCWMEQQEEGFQLDDIKACREEFRAAIAAIEDKLNAKAGDKTADHAAADKFIVFFGFDSTAIPASADSILSNAAHVIAKKDGVIVDVVGYTDTSGPDAYNKALSQRRAAAVREALIKRGVSDKQITTSGRGETHLLVPTADGVREPSNRRAEISLR